VRMLPDTQVAVIFASETFVVANPSLARGLETWAAGESTELATVAGGDACGAHWQAGACASAAAPALPPRRRVIRIIERKLQPELVSIVCDASAAIVIQNADKVRYWAVTPS
jgi:hypothetical protein